MIGGHRALACRDAPWDPLKSLYKIHALLAYRTVARLVYEIPQLQPESPNRINRRLGKRTLVAGSVVTWSLESHC